MVVVLAVEAAAAAAVDTKSIQMPQVQQDEVEAEVLGPQEMTVMCRSALSIQNDAFDHSAVAG